MTIGDQIKKPESSGISHKWDWILWWRIDPVDLEEQVRLYDTIGFRSSMRGISALCLALSTAVTVAMTLFGAAGPSAYVDAGLMAVLAVFIGLGHRWAMIAAMILWTLEKALVAVSALPLAITQVLWWGVYMHAFYFAYRVELRRRKKPNAEDVF